MWRHARSARSVYDTVYGDRFLDTGTVRSSRPPGCGEGQPEPRPAGETRKSLLVHLLAPVAARRRSGLFPMMAWEIVRAEPLT